MLTVLQPTFLFKQKLGSYFKCWWQMYNWFELTFILIVFALKQTFYYCDKYFFFFKGWGKQKIPIMHLAHVSPLNGWTEGVVSKLQSDRIDMSTRLSAQETAMTNSSSSLLRHPENTSNATVMSFQMCKNQNSLFIKKPWIGAHWRKYHSKYNICLFKTITEKFFG